MRYEESLLALFFMCRADEGELNAPPEEYGISVEERETAELLEFVRQARRELRRRGTSTARQVPVRDRIRITRTLRIYVGEEEVRTRPMAKCVLLLFLRHPEGILLKNIADYRCELSAYYRRLSRSGNPEAIENSIERLLDVFSNSLNINISRVNSALEALLENPEPYTIYGTAGKRKAIRLPRNMVVWE